MPAVQPVGMSDDPTRREFLGAGGTALTAALAGCSSATPFVGKREEFDREYDLTDGSLAVVTDSGGVTVSRTDADAVELRGVKEASSVFADLADATVEATRDGERLRIVADSGDDGILGLAGVSVDLEVGVPDGVAVEEVEGRNGDVTATGVAGDASLESTNGDVEARDVDGFVRLESTNGTVHASDVAGLDDAETTNGDADVEVPAMDGDVTVESTNGNVVAALSPDLDAEVFASTTTGSVSATGLSLAERGAMGDEHVGTLGDGTHRLVFETTNGDVTLSRLG